MKILIVGGSRFFGKRLAADWLDAGAEVTLLTRGVTEDGFGDRVRRILGDRSELRKDSPLLGDGKWDIVYDQVCYDSFQAEGAVAAFRGRCGRFVFTSTQSVYGPGAALKETDFDPIRHSLSDRIAREKDYGEAKRQAEAYFFRQSDFPLCAVRFPIVLGEDDYTRRLHWHVERVQSGEAIYFPNPDARIGFVNSPDASRALMFLGTHSFHGAVNVCSPDAITLRALLATIEAAAGRRAILSSSASLEGKETSPMGIGKDWYMNIARLQRLGCPMPALGQWLPALVQSLTA